MLRKLRGETLHSPALEPSRELCWLHPQESPSHFPRSQTGRMTSSLWVLFTAEDTEAQTEPVSGKASLQNHPFCHPSCLCKEHKSHSHEALVSQVTEG